MQVYSLSRILLDLLFLQVFYFILLDVFKNTILRYLLSTFYFVFSTLTFIWKVADIILCTYLLSTVLYILLSIIYIFYICKVADIFHSFSLKGQCHEIFCFRFFHDSPSPKPLIITLGSFQIFSKIRGYIRKSRCTTGVNDTGGKLSLVSTTPAANLPPVSTTRRQILPPVPLVLLTPVANNGNNFRLQTPESELEGKNLYICFLYYPKVTKQNY